MVTKAECDKQGNGNGTITLTYADGRTLELAPYGYEADGISVTEIINE
jgi:hypothetical protein